VNFRKLLFHFLIVCSFTVAFSSLVYFLNPPADENLLLFILNALVGFIFFLLPPVYWCIYWLIPQFLIQKKYVPFVVGLLCIVFGFGYLTSTLEPLIDHYWFGLPAETQHPSKGIWVMVFIVGLTVPLNLSYRWFSQSNRLKQLENDHLKKELSLLKAQINPHFFFNTLNNLYALSLEKSEKTPQVILKLSELMRYTIYDCKAAFVPLASEITYIENYIALQQIRHFDCQIVFRKNITAQIEIAPLILIVLIENAFKHGAETMSDGAFVQIDLAVSEQEIHFKVENNFKEVPTHDSSGMGLENAHKRLALIYPQAYTFHTYTRGDFFIASLRICLKTIINAKK